MVLRLPVEASFIIPLTQSVRIPEKLEWRNVFYSFSFFSIYNINGGFQVPGVSTIQRRVFKTMDEVLHVQCYTLLKYNFKQVEIDMGGREGIYHTMMKRLHTNPAGNDPIVMVPWFNLILATMYEDYYETQSP